MRLVSELAYHDYITQELPSHELLGELVRDKLLYYPLVTRESFRNQGRLTDLIVNGKMAADLGMAPLNPHTDRAMMCGSPSMLTDLCKILDERGFHISASQGEAGDSVIERAFVEK